MTEDPPLLDYGNDNPPEEVPKHPKTWSGAVVIGVLLVLAAIAGAVLINWPIVD